MPTRALLCLFYFLSAGTVLAQMSPGPLSRAHRDLEGPLSCSKCHAFGTGKVEMKCLDCHQEIARRIDTKRGYHALQVKPGTKSNDCARCHSEHNGLNEQLVRWPTTKERFNHDESGFHLEGRHAELKCAECHNSKFLDPADRAVLKRANLSSTFAGLTARCTACHEDTHKGELGPECTSCHSQSTWKTTPNFSHSRARYQLTGKHVDVDCNACHKPASDTVAAGVPRYRNFVKFEECGSCHSDPHSNSFGGYCQRCHTTAGWKVMAANGRIFDHSRTRFPLIGAHVAADCQSCHKPGALTTNPSFNLCSDCHSNPHEGQFSAQLAEADCKDCHDENSFKKTTFGVAEHARSSYALVGQHATVACEKCHVVRNEHTVFKLQSANCTDCHKDAHNSQFAGLPHKNRCEDCHVVEGWQPSTFGLAAHNETHFTLTGAHRAVPCSGCHTPQQEQTRFHVDGGRCINCHESPHGSLAAAFTCESCHKTTSWAQVAYFDHSVTQFPLAGRHTAVPCLGCHKPEARGNARVITFGGMGTQCESCHEDAHDGQFKANDAAQGCAECHTPKDWRPTQFDHNRHSTFALDGAHKDVPCRMCHTDRREIAGRLVVQYKGTPRDCKDCHK